MGRLTEYMALANMTSKERKKYAYGTNAQAYFSHIEITNDLLNKITHKR